MSVPNLILFYVEDPLVSAEFYQKLFGREPVFIVPTYVAFKFENGLHFALWSTAAKDFVSGGEGNRCELSFMVGEETEVRSLHQAWIEQGVVFEQPLQQAVFGLTFVALDPDGHRIRVCLTD